MADLIPSEKSVFTSFSSKIIKSVNFRVLVPEAFSIGLVGDWEREDCLTKKDHPYEMGDKFVGIMNMKISASATNFYIFVHLLKSLGEAERALARDMEAAVGVYRAEDRIPAATLQKMNLALGGTQTTAGSVAAGAKTKGTIETDSSGASPAAPPTTQPQSLAPTESAATVSVLGGDKSIIAAGGKGSTSAAGGKGSTIVTGGHYSQTVHHHYGQSSSQLSGGASPVVPPTTSQPQTLAPLTADEVMDQLDTVEFPLHLWRRLANGLKLGGQTSKFNEGTDNNDKLQRLITHWIDNEEHSWQQLVKAMVKCEQKIKARQLARNVGAPPE